MAVILGKTGKNLCAGMSGGVAYILDEKHDLYKRLNKEMVTMYDLDDETTVARNKTDCEILKDLIEQHYEETASKKAKKILEDWENYIPKFKKIIPNDYLRMMTEIRLAEESGEIYEDAVMSAFKKVTA